MRTGPNLAACAYQCKPLVQRVPMNGGYRWIWACPHPSHCLWNGSTRFGAYRRGSSDVWSSAYKDALAHMRVHIYAGDPHD